MSSGVSSHSLGIAVAFPVSSLNRLAPSYTTSGNVLKHCEEHAPYVTWRVGGKAARWGEAARWDSEVRQWGSETMTRLFKSNVSILLRNRMIDDKCITWEVKGQDVPEVEGWWGNGEVRDGEGWWGMVRWGEGACPEMMLICLPSGNVPSNELLSFGSSGGSFGRTLMR
jgi:hypothetical protein